MAQFFKVFQRTLQPPFVSFTLWYISIKQEYRDLFWCRRECYKLFFNAGNWICLVMLAELSKSVMGIGCCDSLTNFHFFSHPYPFGVVLPKWVRNRNCVLFHSISYRTIFPSIAKWITSFIRCKKCYSFHNVFRNKLEN